MIAPDCRLLTVLRFWQWARLTWNSALPSAVAAFERDLGISLFVDFDHERYSSLGVAKRKRLACVIAVRTALDHSAAKLGFVGIVKINDGERDTRIASSVLCLERAFPGGDQDVVIFSAYPNGDALRRAAGHQSGEVGVGRVDLSPDCSSENRPMRGRRFRAAGSWVCWARFRINRCFPATLSVGRLRQSTAKIGDFG